MQCTTAVLALPPRWRRRRSQCWISGLNASRREKRCSRCRRAQRADAPNKRALRHVSREFVGFNMAPAADTILNDAPHSVTLVFSDRLIAKQRLEFPFAWPVSLVNANGSCRGRAEVTLCYTPPIDPDHREEAIWVQLEAYPPP